MELRANQQISDQDLLHWKYIRKYRVNGKWRYVYNNKYKVGSLLDRQRPHSREKRESGNSTEVQVVKGKNYIATIHSRKKRVSGNSTSVQKESLK